MAIPTALRYIRLKTAGQGDLAFGILYNDGMVLALECEREGEYALVTGASLLTRGITFTALPIGGSDPLMSVAAPCSLKSSNPAAANLPAILFKSKVFFREPGGAGRAVDVHCSQLVEAGANIISRNGPNGFRWG